MVLKKGITLLLSIIMAFSLLSTNVWASKTQTTSKTFESIEDAGKYLRVQLTKRKGTIKFSVRTKKGNKKTILNKVGAEALKYTGKPTEGDYLNRNIRKESWKLSEKRADGKYVYSYTGKIKYLTTATQEKETTKEVKKILKKLDIKKENELTRVCKIYYYIRDNVYYDMVGFDPEEDKKDNYLSHTAYAGIVRKVAVCEGISQTFYRLCLECGIPCRVITGTVNGGEHAWNIVQVNGKYYNADATLGSFLLSDSGMDGYKRDSYYASEKFYRKHPMSKKDLHKWNKVIIEPSCTEEGYYYYVCEYCRCPCEEETVIPPTGHAWKLIDAYQDDDGTPMADFCCETCGETESWIPSYEWPDYGYKEDGTKAG